MNVVRVRVSLKSLAEALHLPVTSRVRYVWHENENDPFGKVVTLLIEDSCLPPVADGCLPLVANPTWHVECVEGGYRRVSLTDWGIEDAA